MPPPPNQWYLPAEQLPPLHQQVLVELRHGPGQVCDVACYLGKVAMEPGVKAEDRWILADVSLDTRQIKRWAYVYPVPPPDLLAEARAEALELAARMAGAYPALAAEIRALV